MPSFKNSRIKLLRYIFCGQMSEGDKKKADEQKNTNAWKEKQEQKKREKEARMKEGGEDKKEDKKKKKKAKEEQAVAKVEEVAEKVEVKEERKEEKKEIKQEVVYRNLETIDSAIISKHPELAENRVQQKQLLKKAMQNLYGENNVVLYLGDSQLSKKCKFVHIPGLTDFPDSDIICRYEDIGYLLEDTVDRVICEAEVIFRNGSALVRKGYLNILAIAEYYRVPIVLSCGSWRYCGISPGSEEELSRKYGESALEDYEWTDASGINLLAMEFGAILTSQISEHIAHGYKNFGLYTVSW